MLSIDRHYIAMMVEAGFIYLGMQRFSEAKKVFEGVRVLAPENDIPIVALGNVEFCQGELEKAIKYYNEALKLNGDSLFAQVYLGEAMFFNDERDEALKILGEVKKADPRGAAGGFAMALLKAIEEGFNPPQTKVKKTKKGSHAKKKKK